jgi:hypothetical protein
LFSHYFFLLFLMKPSILSPYCLCILQIVMKKKASMHYHVAYKKKVYKYCSVIFIWILTRDPSTHICWCQVFLSCTYLLPGNSSCKIKVLECKVLLRLNFWHGITALEFLAWHNCPWISGMALLCLNFWHGITALEFLAWYYCAWISGSW